MDTLLILILILSISKAFMNKESDGVFEWEGRGEKSEADED
jgi:hypothetical protein